MSELNVERRTINKGDYYVVQKVGGEQSRVVRFTPKQKVLIEKLKFEADSAIDQPCGLFEVVSGKCIPMTVQKLIEELEVQEAVVAAEGKEGVNGGKAEEADSLRKVDSVESSTDEQSTSAGRTVIAPSALQLDPAQARQVLTQDEVLELKKQGTAAHSLVAKLVEGSASFSTRTSYSQSKYIKRKTKKHSDRVLILRPTLRLLATSYYLKDADRVANLRIDQMGMLLQMAGIHYGKRVVVFEQVLGLVTSSIIERLGGYGSCVHIHKGAIAQSIPCVLAMNYDQKTMKTFLPVRIQCVLAGKQQPYDNHREFPHNKPVEEEMQEEKEEKEKEEKMDEVDEASNARRADRLDRERRGLELIERGADSLVIASRTVDPVSVLEQIYPKLRQAATVAIYSPHFQPMVEAYEWLVKNNAIHMQFTDQLYRAQQVLPDRTHPLMSQHIVGGFVLTAIKVSSSTN